MLIYVVMGECGEHLDRSEWPVKAFVDKHDAETLIANATIRGQEITAAFNRDYEAKLGENQFDPMHTGYTGVSYFFYEVELEQ